MYLRVQARAASDHSILTAAAEQLGHELLVRHRTGTAGSYPLVVPLQHGIGFGRIQILRRRTTFKRPQSPVFVHRQHHGGLTTKVNEVKLVVVDGRLCVHMLMLKKIATFGMDITRARRTITNGSVGADPGAGAGSAASKLVAGRTLRTHAGETLWDRALAWGGFAGSRSA